MKTCTKCTQELPLDAFYASTRGGRMSRCKACIREYYLANKEAYITRALSRYYADPQGCSAASYAARKRRGRAAEKAKRRADTLQRTPSWSNQHEVRAKYKLCKQISELTGIPHHVDHIVPLQGALVSGLHVHWNLQVIPARENLRKSNKYAP